MLKKLNTLMNTVMGTVFGVFLGHSAYVVWHYRTYPDLYAAQSAPWYTSILVYGCFTLVVLLAVAIIKIVIHKKSK